MRNRKGPNPIPANVLAKLHNSIPCSLLADLEIDFFLGGPPGHQHPQK